MAYERAFRGWSASNVSDLVDLDEDRSSGRLSYHVFTAADLPAYRSSPPSSSAPPRSINVVTRVAFASLAVGMMAFTGALVMLAGEDAAPPRARVASVAAAFPAAMPATMELPAAPAEAAPQAVVELDLPETAPVPVVKAPAKPKPRILVPKNPYE